MAHGNAATEEHVVAVAKPQPDERVLVIGPGPGVGLHAAADRSRLAVGVDPSETMLRRCRERCAADIRAGRADTAIGSASATGQDSGSFDAVLSVNNVHLWPDRAAGFAELYRTLRPGGRLILSAHERWLPVTRHELAAEIGAAGFADLQTWTWDPPGMGGTRAAQLRAYRPTG